MKNLIKNILRHFGYELRSLATPDFEKEFITLSARVSPYTMTSRERQYALYQAVKYIEQNGIEGAIVECGVWKGGSTMLAAWALQAEGSADRSLYLYDTFAGMSEPTDKDINLHGSAAREKWAGMQRDVINEWDYAGLDEVRGNLASTGYPSERITMVSGKVEDTIPGTVPERIALLRLDTDWYESTRHELEHLFPRLVPGGVLIIDDYGHWQGARAAVDEYFNEHKIPMLLTRIDYTGRMGVKVDAR